MNTLIFTAAALGGVRRVAQPVLGTFGTDHHGGDHHMGAHHCSSSDSPQLQRVRAVAGAGAIFAKLDAQARGEYEVAIRQIRWVLVLQAYIHRKISTKPRCDLVLWDVTTVPPSATPPKTSPAIAEPAPLMLADATKRLLPWLVAVAFFMESLDTTILNTAVPTIAEALKVAPLSMKSVLSSYTLSLAVFIPISGWMADRFGTRRVFAAAIGLFTLGSFLCGISTSIEMLVAFRLLQGVGGAMMMPVGRLTMVRTFA
ncbi:MAG: MFS transporter, partial [Gemmatimonas sp.]